MENAITVNLTPLQVLLSLAFQVWMIVFPIILIRKINYLTDIIQEQFYPNNNRETQ
ncbi:MAG: hypothetical protein HZA29_00695 [Candidatus Omnitrophica bacterium]|jgi:hypothetical protein|nr:hypothetical protein [Candidatus Omnitrophota bacterium]